MDGKLWKIGLIVLGLGVLTFSIVRTVLSTDRPVLADTIVLVDVVTGELFEVPRRGIVMPAKRHDTGERRLFRVEQEDGVWRVPRSYIPREEGTGRVPALDRVDGKPDALNVDSGVVTTTGEPKYVGDF